MPLIDSVKFFLFFLGLFFFFSPLQGETLDSLWKKDFDLQNCRTECLPCTKKVKNPLTLFSKVLISFHQDIISPADGPRSHFYPSSSQYTLEAIQKHGFFIGVPLGMGRLMRENDDPWIYPVKKFGENNYLKLDPVP